MLRRLLDYLYGIIPVIHIHIAHVHRVYAPVRLSLETITAGHHGAVATVCLCSFFSSFLSSFFRVSTRERFSRCLPAEELYAFCAILPVGLLRVSKQAFRSAFSVGPSEIAVIHRIHFPLKRSVPSPIGHVHTRICF